MPEAVPPEHLRTLIDIYTSIGRTHQKGNDAFSYDRDLKLELRNLFKAATGVDASPDVLLAVIRDLRKAGLLERIGISSLPKSSFRDLDEAAAM